MNSWDVLSEADVDGVILNKARNEGSNGENGDQSPNVLLSNGVITENVLDPWLGSCKTFAFYHPLTNWLYAGQKMAFSRLRLLTLFQLATIAFLLLIQANKASAKRHVMPRCDKGCGYNAKGQPGCRDKQNRIVYCPHVHIFLDVEALEEALNVDTLAPTPGPVQAGEDYHITDYI
jgi:hypothetical protein